MRKREKDQMTYAPYKRKRRRKSMSLQTTRATIWRSRVGTGPKLTRVRTCSRLSTCERRRIPIVRSSN